MPRSRPEAFVLLLRRFLFLFIPKKQDYGGSKIEIPVKNRRSERKIQKSGGFLQEYAEILFSRQRTLDVRGLSIKMPSRQNCPFSFLLCSLYTSYFWYSSVSVVSYSGCLLCVKLSGPEFKHFNTVGVGHLFGQLTFIFTPPPLTLGYMRLPRFRVRHLQPQLFRVVFGREGRVNGIWQAFICVCFFVLDVRVLGRDYV